jgi:hypothetical protein
VKDGSVEVKHLGTEEVISDMLTKALGGKKFRELRTKLLGYCDHGGMLNVIDDDPKKIYSTAERSATAGVPLEMPLL